MSQSNIIQREKAVYLGEESTFGSVPASTFPNSMVRALVQHDALLADGMTREMLDVTDVRVRRADAIQPVQGLEIASKVGGLSWMLKATPSANQLTSSGTPGEFSERLALRHAFGAEWANVGSTVATGTSSTVFDVASSEGSRFKKGSFVVVNGEVAKITNVSTDTITVTPALSNTPNTSDVVRNLYSYAMAESHTSSLAVQVAFVGDSAAQYQLVGCHGDVAFNFGEWGKLVTMALDLTGSNYTTGSLSLSTATTSDQMGAGFPFAPRVYLATSISRGTTLVCEKVAIEMKNSWEMVRDPSATQTVAAVVNTAGRPRAAKVNLTTRFDSAYPTAFDAETKYRFLMVQQIGSGATASYWVWEAPVAYIVGTPKLTKVGGRLYMDIELNLLQDDQIALAGATGNDADRVYSPLRVAFG